MHDRAVATAIKLIKKNGRDITLRGFVNSGSEFSPTRTPVNQAVKAVQSRFSANEIGGPFGTSSGETSSLVQPNDKLFLIDSVVKPTLDMELVDDGTYAVKGILEIKPGETTILYKVQAR